MLTCLLAHTTCLSLFVQSDSDWGEHVAKLINVLGCELCQIYAENDLPADAKTTAYALIEKTWPFMLKFLGDEYDDTSCAVLNFVNDTLTLVSYLGLQIYRHIDRKHHILISLIVQEAEEGSYSFHSIPVGLFVITSRCCDDENEV